MCPSATVLFSMQVWPSTHAFGSFLIAARDSDRLRHIMCSNGAHRHELGPHVVYLWNSPEGQRLFSGIGVVDGIFLRGPRILDRTPDSMIGYCALLDFVDGIWVRADEFGMYPVCYSDETITDRLHLAMMAQPAIDAAAALSVYQNDWMFGQQLNTMRMPVAGFRMLGVGESLELSGRVRLQRYSPPNELLEPDEYHELIRAGADEIRTNIGAALDANKRVVFAIDPCRGRASSAAEGSRRRRTVPSGIQGDA